MGNQFFLQACLRWEEGELPQLALGKKYHFKKKDHRIYQLNVPMDLLTADWKFLGRIIVTEYTVGNGRTEGTFILVKEFSEAEKAVISTKYMNDAEVTAVLQKVRN